VLLGDEWVAALGRSGFAPAQVTAITKHLEADRAHSAHGLAEIDRFPNGGTDEDGIFDGIAEAERLFEAFCDEVHTRALEAPSVRAS
jgi:hypothetical protein